jgi:hypothetical protein
MTGATTGDRHDTGARGVPQRRMLEPDRVAPEEIIDAVFVAVPAP